MSAEHLQHEMSQMLFRVEEIERWRRTAGGIRVPAAADDWGKYSVVKKQLDDAFEQIEKLKGQIEQLWDQIGDIDAGSDSRAGHERRHSVVSGVPNLHVVLGRGA